MCVLFYNVLLLFWIVTQASTKTVVVVKVFFSPLSIFYCNCNVCDAFEEGCHLQGLVNGSNATVLSLDFIIFGSFRPNLRSLFNRFTQTIYDNKNDAYCRSLSSIRKYYTNLWSITYLSMSATALTKARNILLSLTMLMMPNATIFKMLYKQTHTSTLHFASPYNVSLVFLLVTWFFS
jgi:hypothetical protein